MVGGLLFMDLIIALVKYQRENKHSTCWNWNGIIIVEGLPGFCYWTRYVTPWIILRHWHLKGIIITTGVSGLLFMSTILHKVLGCTFYLSSQQPSLCVSNPKAQIHHDAVPTSKSEASTCQCFREAKYRWDTAKPVSSAAFMSQNPGDFSQERSCMEWVFFLSCSVVHCLGPLHNWWCSRDCYPNQPEGSSPPTIFVTCDISS